MCIVFVICCELELRMFISTLMLTNVIYSRCRVAYGINDKGLGHTGQSLSHLMGDSIQHILFCLVRL